MKKELRNHLIEKYRESIYKRYDYKKIKKDPMLPEGFDEKVANELRTFFLDSLYSSPQEREKLDAAFSQLESYVNNPSKITGVIGNLAAAIFQFGFHLPAAIKTGIDTLQTHTAARKFEQALYQNALDRKYKAPLTDEQFNECMAALPEDQVEHFIKVLVDLFNHISDDVIMEKTIHILEDVLKRMKERNDLYGKDDLDAIQLGISILSSGRNLLLKYDNSLKQGIVEFVKHSELKFMRELRRK
ncbi:MAG: hypothetical protein IPH78_13515 [Bacteroidetes bacterium]|nr:hypothetical protein [Bacteroidota bacterium]MBK8659911.1 hypothetical protein [Bacteroidota bacterium]